MQIAVPMIRENWEKSLENRPKLCPLRCAAVQFRKERHFAVGVSLGSTAARARYLEQYDIEDRVGKTNCEAATANSRELAQRGALPQGK
ncbi:hypothetical protein HG15A2_16330 [Adhaeretor mobilis]|uniref:Uncharacterized protein n=1 Tax=Adhaeretor mobilis TaxID=1930276 RepID=A0A517MTZ8_9BACT|nr:hypothetical protein HG15A2_16330 [Adhaeretor mobilis]